MDADDTNFPDHGQGLVNIHHLARLAALRLDGDERLGVERDLGRIIALVDEMQAVDTEGVDPLAHPLDATQRLRADEATEQIDRERYQAGSPEARDGLYLVPRVIE